MSTTQQTLDGFEADTQEDTELKDCPACGESVTPTQMPEHLRKDCQGVNREVRYE